jgi:hypothetical protein
MSDQPTNRGVVDLLVGLFGGLLAFFGLSGAGVATMYAASGFHGLDFGNTWPVIALLAWGGLSGVALFRRARIARVSLLAWVIAVAGWCLVLALESPEGASDAGAADVGSAAPSTIASPAAAEAQTAMKLPEPVPTDPAQLDVPPAFAVERAADACTVEVVAQQAALPGSRATPVATRLEFGISTSRNEQGEPLMEIETAPDGTARFELPWTGLTPGVDGKRPWLWLRSGGAGLLARITQAQAPAEPGATVKMYVVVQPGTMISGRILGPDGAPVAGRVDWWSFGPEGISSSSVGSAGPDGLFTGELLREGTTGLWATGTSDENPDFSVLYDNGRLDLGTGFSELFEVRFDEPVPFIEVRVSGPGVLRGRVVDENGTPAAGLNLMVVVAELDDEQGSLRLPYPRMRELEQEGGGHIWVTTVTGGDGGFELRGLRNDLYHVRAAPDGKGYGGYPALLTPRAVPSHGDPLELVLTRPHLAIHVREADGSLPEEEVVVHRVASFRRTLDEWPDEAGLLVALGARHAHRNGWRGPYLRAKSVGPGEFVVELEGMLLPDEALELDVGVLGGEAPWQLVRFEAPPASGCVDVDLVLPEPAPKGALVLDVVDAQGAVVLEQVRIRIVDPVSGVVLLDTSVNYHHEGDWPMRFELPEGDYRLLVEGHPWIDDHHGTVMRRRVHGAYEQPLHVSAGSETRVTATLGAAARLSVRTVGQVTEADRQAVRDDNDGRANEEYVEYWAPYVSLRLEREGRWPEQPEFARSAMEGTSAAGTHLFSSVELGHEETSEPLSPGDYTLVASTRGGRELRRAITLLPGETLSVTLQFD